MNIYLQTLQANEYCAVNFLVSLNRPMTSSDLLVCVDETPTVSKQPKFRVNPSSKSLVAEVKPLKIRAHCGAGNSLLRLQFI